MLYRPHIKLTIGQAYMQNCIVTLIEDAENIGPCSLPSSSSSSSARAAVTAALYDVLSEIRTKAD